VVGVLTLQHSGRYVPLLLLPRRRNEGGGSRDKFALEPQVRGCVFMGLPSPRLLMSLHSGDARSTIICLLCSTPRSLTLP